MFIDKDLHILVLWLSEERENFEKLNSDKLICNRIMKYCDIVNMEETCNNKK